MIGGHVLIRFTRADYNPLYHDQNPPIVETVYSDNTLKGYV
jgi:hypothetical protein